MAVHGHDMNGTKFFTWGQSGPGRFMQGGREPSINDVRTEKGIRELLIFPDQQYVQVDGTA